MNLSNWTVLIVDDEPDSLEVMYEVLTMDDAKVHTASSAEEAVELLQTMKPNLIITDLSMPGMDGYALLPAIRAIKGLEQTPIIALTAHAMTGDKERVIGKGFTGYITKPIRMGTIISDILSFVPELKPAS